MDESVRVRFAPSPTGPLHIGGVRTALFNYLFARKHNGKMILRIEDTDQKRYVEEAEEYLTEALDWCGIEIDEGPGSDGKLGPYRQSERTSRYRDYAEQLVEDGLAYYAFDTEEELAEVRKQWDEKGETFIYNHNTRTRFTNQRTMIDEEVEERIERGDDYVIRFKPPLKEVTIHDKIRGEITVDTRLIDDKVLFKSDGKPTYHLANVIDDEAMKITHVIRGEEWLPSVALHVLLYESFNWEPPVFAHLPLILKPTGNGKLSKRDGLEMDFPVLPLAWNSPGDDRINPGFREEGFLPEAVVNMLALLGWNPGTEQEIFSMEQLIEAFSLDDVNKAGSKYDPDKTVWFQQQWFTKQEDEVIAAAFAKVLDEQQIPYPDQSYVNTVTTLVKERATFLTDLLESAKFFFEAPKFFDREAIEKCWKENTADIMKDFATFLSNSKNDKAADLQAEAKSWIKEEGHGFGKVMMPLRMILVGSLKGPDVFEIVAMIGKEETNSRIDYAIDKLED